MLELNKSIIKDSSSYLTKYYFTAYVQTKRSWKRLFFKLMCILMFSNLTKKTQIEFKYEMFRIYLYVSKQKD